MAVGGTVSFGGLASGLDTKSIVEKLTDLKKTQLINPLEDTLANTQDKIDAYDPIIAAYTDLKSKSRTLKSLDNIAWNSKTAVSSDTDKLIISALTSSSVSTGSYEISEVTQLAQADRVYFNGVADTTTSQFGTGSLSFTYKGVSSSVTINASNNTLSGIKNAINDADIGIIASIVNDGDATNPYRLLLTSEDTGSDTAITQDIAAVLTLTLDAATSGSAVNQPQSAAFKVNGLSVSSSSNTVTSAIQGMSFSLLETNAAGTTTITVKQDNDKISKSITSFVESYAKMMKTLRDSTLVDPETGEFGILGQELIISQSFNNINSIFNKRYTSLGSFDYQSLAQLGITTDILGNIQVDSSKLNSALENNLENVQSLFQGTSTEDGVAEDMFDYADSMINGAGLITKKIAGFQSNIRRLNERLEERQAQVNSYELQLFTKFNKLEQTLSLMQQDQQAIESFIGMYSSSSNRLL